MRKQGSPPSRRKQAVASLLNMPLIRTLAAQGPMRPADRGRAILARALRRGRVLPHQADERQDHRLAGLVRQALAIQPLPFLLLPQLLKLEALPQLAEARLARVAEQGGAQHGSGVFRATRLPQS